MMPMLRVFSRGKLRGIDPLGSYWREGEAERLVSVRYSRRKKALAGQSANVSFDPNFSYVAPFSIETVNAQGTLWGHPRATGDDSSGMMASRQGIGRR
jgi:hypothetical protein